MKISKNSKVTAASKQVGPIPEFTKACEAAAYSILGGPWIGKLHCYYDGGPHSKRDFALKAAHSWGTAYLEWTADIKDELYDALRKLGATNIIGKVDWNYVDIAFDISAKALKQYQADSQQNVTAAFDRDWYFGKEEADQFGDLIVKKLAGKTVSKRRDKAEEPGGLIFEADRLGIDMWDLLRALEGMCYDGRAREIDDSTYKVLGDLEDSENVYSGSSPFLLLEEIFSADDDGDIVDNFLKDACEALGCTTKEWDYKNYLGETETHVLLVDRKGKTIGMLDLHYPEDIMKIYEENDHDYDATSEKVMQYLKDEINMFSEAYDDNVITL